MKRHGVYGVNINRGYMSVKVRETLYEGKRYVFKKPYEFDMRLGQTNYDGTQRSFITKNEKLRIGIDFDDMDELMEFVAKRVADDYNEYVNAGEEFLGRSYDLDRKHFLKNVECIDV